MLITQPLKFEDFSGGITDTYLDGPLNQGQEVDNFFITDNKKLKTRPGSEVSDTTNYLPSYIVLNQRTSSMWLFEDQLFEQQGRNIYYNSSGYSTLLGSSSNPAFAAGDTTSFVSFTSWNKHLIVTNDAFGSVMKIYKDSGGTFRVRTAGMPDLATSPIVTPVAGANTYIYAFLYYYTYTIGTVVHEDFGPVTEVTATAAAAPNVSAIAISVIPVLANGATENYDTANIKVKIYRSQNGGTSLTYVGQVTNGTTTYNDTASDASIVNAVPIYTEGGILDNDPPPKAKYVTTANDCVWYGHVKEGTQVFTNRIRQSNKFDPDGCPTDFVTDVEDEITGMGAIGIYPIAFCTSRIYRIEGFYALDGRGYIESREISRTVGCVSHNSIVNTRDGLVFAGQDGFYITDGFQVKKLTKHLNATYKVFVASATLKKRIYGMYEPLANRVWWTVQFDSSSPDNDGCMVLDLKQGISETASFTTMTGGTSFAPTSLCMSSDGFVMRADRRGYLLKHDEDLSTDVKIDTTVAPSLWEEKAIIYDYISVATPFGITDVRKWVPVLTLTAQNISNTSCAVYSENDDSQIEDELKEIRFRSNITWGDSSITWGDASLIWNYNKLIDEKRRFPAGGLRCAYKQIRLTNSLTITDRSDDLGEATVSAAGLSVTLNTAPTNVWADDVVDYFIYFDFDSYTTAFQITARTDSVLTVTDPTTLLQNDATAKWIIKGYKKGDLLLLLNFNIMFAPLSASQDTFQASETGAND